MDQRKSSVDWERDIYAKGCQINRWPFDEVISAVIHATAGLNRSVVSVLEMGCGAGNNIWFLATEGFKAFGLDISPTAIEHAKQRMAALNLEAELIVGDINRLPWSENTFDIVIDRGALTQLEHERVAQGIEEARRVLKPRGVMMSFTLYGMNYPERLFGEEVSYHTFDHFRDGYFRTVGLTSFFTRDDLKDLFGSFQKMRIERTTIHDDEDRLTSECFTVIARK